MKKENLLLTRKNQILDAAISIFAKKGFASAKTDDIARLANLGKGTIYRYFKNKKALFLALIDRGLEGLRDLMSKEVGNVEDPLEKIETAIKTYLSFFEKNSSFVDLLVHEHSGFHERIRKKYFEHYYGNIDKIKQTFKLAIRKGIIKNINIDDAIRVLTSTLKGLIYMWHVEGKRYSLIGKSNSICKIFFTGIIKDENRKKKYL